MKKELNHVFDVGDLCSNQKGHLFVITNILKDGSYEFINLQTESIATASHGLQVIAKGSISSQPFSVFDKYNYLYQSK